MDEQAARRWLAAQWERVLAARESEPDPVLDRLVNSKIMSLRYALITQILGKIADPGRSLLCVQKAAGIAGAWDARSFCKKVVVPWVQANDGVLGRSTDPYVSNPLRRERLEREMPKVKGKDWDALVALLESLENVEPGELQAVFGRCLAAVARLLADQSLDYPVPVSLSLARLQKALDAFLQEKSGGLRPMAVTAALMRVLGKGFNLFERVETQGVNEADVAKGVPGDVMCYAADASGVIAIEVKDRKINLQDVQASLKKAQDAKLRFDSFLFIAPKADIAEKKDIEEVLERVRQGGMEVNHIELIDLVASNVVLLGEKWRPQLLLEIGKELDSCAELSHRRAWQSILASLVASDQP